MFGNRIDFATLTKIHADSPGEGRYSPGRVIGTHAVAITGQPTDERICTSHAERANLTMRMAIRRLTRLTNAHSKKWRNQDAALALYFAYYNLCRVHMTLGQTPATAAGLTDHAWSVGEFVQKGFAAMLEKIEVHNFRSCKQVAMDSLSGIVALVGKNASGKTNVLKAIEWASKFASSSTPDDSKVREVLFPFFDLGQLPKIVMQVRIKKKTYVYSFAFCADKHGTSFALNIEESLYLKDNGGEQQLVCQRKGMDVQIPSLSEKIAIGQISCLPALESLLAASSDIVKQIRPFLEFLRRVTYYPLIEPSDAASTFENGWIQEDEYKAWMVGYKRTGNPGESVIFKIIHMSATDPTRFTNLQSLIGSSGLALIDRIIVAKHQISDQAHSPGPGKKVVYNVSFIQDPDAPGRGTHPLPYQFLSCGTLPYSATSYFPCI